MKFDVALLAHQRQFLTAQEKFVWLRAGLGSGKTYALAHWLINRMLTNPETLGMVAAATYKQLNRSILNELFRQLDILGLKYSGPGTDGLLTLHYNGAKLLCFSLENYEVLRGIELGYIGIDEVCMTKEDAYNVAIGRLRCKFSHKLQLRCTSTPRGYDFMYDRYASDQKRDNHLNIHATGYDNPHLPDGYIDDLKANYTAKGFRQEVMAEFISNSEGNIYHAFDRAEHIKPCIYDPSKVIWVGMDFNVNPMTAVLAHVDRGVINVFSELYLENSNTFAMAKELADRYRPHSIKITPDASGRARKTSAKQSDVQILTDAGFKVLVEPTNPEKQDRFNTVNGRLAEGRLNIDPSCVKLIRDLERVTFDETDDDLTHISDALGYLAWKIYPIKRYASPSRVIQL